MPGVRRDLVAPLVVGTNAILTHEPLDTFFGRCKSSTPQLTHRARTALGAFEFGMERADHRQHLAFRQPFALRCAATFPCPVAAGADIKPSCISVSANALPCSAIQAYFTRHPSRSTVHACLRHLWKTKFQGKLIRTAGARSVPHSEQSFDAMVSAQLIATGGRTNHFS